MIELLMQSDKVGLFLAARPTAVFHLVSFDEGGVVRSLHDVGQADLWLNGGYFVFRREIFDYIRDGEDLVEEPFRRLIEEEKLITFPYRGFWAPMDTLKDKQTLDSLLESGRAPWAVWELARRAGTARLPRPRHDAAASPGGGRSREFAHRPRGGSPRRRHRDRLRRHAAPARRGASRCERALGSAQRERRARAGGAARARPSSSPASRPRTSLSRDSGTASSRTRAGRSRTGSRRLKSEIAPDLVLTHYRHDLHQDHRLVSDLTWNTFRDHLILEYEIPKYDGDFGSPNVFVPLGRAIARRKVETIQSHFASQMARHWFKDDLFEAVMRVRGMESNADEAMAEAFFCRKLVVV